MSLGVRAATLGLAAIFLIGLVTAGSVVAEADASGFDEEVEGVTVELPAEVESDLLDAAEEAADEIPGVPDPTNAGMLYADSGTYLVVADEEIETGQTTAVGTVIDTSEEHVLFADAVETSTRGERVSAADLEDRPEAYDRELVRVTMDYQQVAFNSEAAEGSIVSQLAVGSPSPPLELGVVPPSEAGVWAAANVSETDGLDFSTVELASRLGTGSPLVADFSGTRYWTDAEVTLDVVVLAETTGTNHVADLEVASQRVDDIEAIQAGTYDGEVVTIEADAAEARISTKETLVSALPCGSDAFYVGATCVPAVTDAVVHTGVLYDEPRPAPDETLLYTAISNEIQTTPVELAHREVAVTGEVVAASEIDPAFDGRALVVYDVETATDKAGDPPATAAAHRDTAQEQVHQQLVDAAAADGEADIRITDVDHPEVHDGTARIEVTLENRGDGDGEKTVRITLGGSDAPVYNETVAVASGETRSVTSTHDLPETTGRALYVNGERHGFIDPPSESADDDEPANQSVETDRESASDAGAGEGGVVASLGVLPAGLGLTGLTLFVSAAVLDVRRYYRARQDLAADVSRLQLAGLCGTGLLCGQLAAWTVGGTPAVFLGGLFGLSGAATVTIYGMSEASLSDLTSPPAAAVGIGLVWAALTVPIAELQDADGGLLVVGVAILVGGVVFGGGLLVEPLRRLKRRRGGDVTTTAFEAATLLAFGGVVAGMGGLVLRFDGMGALLLLLVIAIIVGWVATLGWVLYKLI